LLLPFYLNGSLDGEEEAQVREHLETCPACGDQLDALSEIGMAIEAHGMPDRIVASAPVAPRWRAVSSRALVAVLALPAFAGIIWALLGFPTGRSVQESLIVPATTLDLGYGPSRGGDEAPQVVLSGAEGIVVLSFSLPSPAGSSRSCEITGPDGGSLARSTLPSHPDPLGRYTMSLSSILFRSPGTYTLSVGAASGGDGSREFRYPFRVDRER
jgi:hypothetical protein